ncbi:GNAT family N-acetyltransferase [Heyndrickxia sporothermodurans]
MKLNLTGNGKGRELEFLKAALEFVKSDFQPQTLTLSVATFNQRAIKVYRKMG